MKNTWSRTKYIAALNFATQYHTGQTYGGATKEQHIDYLNHLVAVTMEIMWIIQHTTDSINADLALQCALLHDTIEDTTANITDIEQLFGTEVARGVQALTKDLTLDSKESQMLDSLNRIKLQPKEVWIVKLADRITNLYHPPFYWDKHKIKSYSTESELIYNHLHTANELLAKRLRQKITEYQRFWQNIT